MNDTNVKEYTAEDFIYKRIDENQFVLSIILGKTPTNELVRVLAISNDAQLTAKLNERCEIERLLRSIETRKKRIISLCSGAVHDKGKIKFIIIKFNEYQEKYWDYTSRAKEYNRKYSALYDEKIEDYYEVKERVESLPINGEKPCERVLMSSADENNEAIIQSNKCKERSIIRFVERKVDKSFVPDPASEKEFINYMNDFSYQQLKPGDVVSGIIVQVNNEEYAVDIGKKQTAYINRQNIESQFKVNDTIEAVVSVVNDGNGCAILHREKSNYSRQEEIKHNDPYKHTNADQNTGVLEQIKKIEDFVHTYPSDKDNGRYSNKTCKRIIHEMLNNGIIPNLAFGKRGSEYIVWVPGIDIIGASENDNQEAISKLGRRLVVEIRRSGLKAFINTGGQYSSVLFGEDATKLSPTEKYNAVMDVLLEATSQGKQFVAGRCASALKRLYDLKLVESPVEHFSRNDSYVSRIPGIDVEGITNALGSEIHRQNAADKDLVREILIHHSQGNLKNLINSSLLSSSFDKINDEWLLSCNANTELNDNASIKDTPNDSGNKEIKQTTPKPAINTTVNLSHLEFSFEEKDDDDDLTF